MYKTKSCRRRRRLVHFLEWQNQSSPLSLSLLPPPPPPPPFPLPSSSFSFSLTLHLVLFFYSQSSLPCISDTISYRTADAVCCHHRALLLQCLQICKSQSCKVDFVTKTLPPILQLQKRRWRCKLHSCRCKSVFAQFVKLVSQG